LTLRAHVAWFYHWSPQVIDALTGTELGWWVDQAKVIQAAQHRVANVEMQSP